MCGRFIQVVDIDKYVSRFGVKRPSSVDLNSNYNLAVGERAYVIANNKPGELQVFEFSYTPSWASKKMYWFNARAEGDFNKENDPNYSGAMGIFDKSAFGQSIKSRRCLIIASGYIEGPEKEKLKKPFHIYRKDKDIFCFAGIWDSWTNKDTGEVSDTFSIITTVANSITSQIGHHRSPIVLDKKDEQRWLDDKLSHEEIVKLLKPHSGAEFVAEPISPEISHAKNKDPNLLIPIGDFAQYTVFTERQSGKKGVPEGIDEGGPIQGSLF